MKPLNMSWWDSGQDAAYFHLANVSVRNPDSSHPTLSDILSLKLEVQDVLHAFHFKTKGKEGIFFFFIPTPLHSLLNNPRSSGNVG